MASLWAPYERVDDFNRIYSLEILHTFISAIEFCGELSEIKRWNLFDFSAVELGIEIEF